MRFFYTCFAILYATLALAQVVNPPAGHVFGESEVPRVYLIIHPDSLASLYLQENWYENHEYQATFVFQRGGVSDTLLLAGVRFRGNTARDKIKKSFRISFNRYVPGRRYHGLKNMNLNAEVNDPSMLRSYTTWSVFREYGVPASRANHSELYINGEYYGLYQNTENINDEFAEARFGDKRGNLYKCSYPANLQYISDNPDDYKMAPWGTRTYELTTNEATDDYSDLARFIAFLNQANQNNLRCRFQEHFDVYNYLKLAAIDVLSGNWDGYIYNQNNFYLYRNPRTDRLQYIPYDLDNTWGIDWLGQNWSNRDVYAWHPQGELRPLYVRLMQIAQYRDVYTWYLRKGAQEVLQSTEWHDQLHAKRNMLELFALSDPYRPLDFGWSDADYLNALGSAAGGHVQFGVIPFMQQRAITALNQSNAIAIAPIISEIRENFAAMPIVFSIAVHTDGPPWQSMQLNYKVNGVSQTPMISSSGQGSHTFYISMMPGLEVVSYNITITGTDGLQRDAYCQDRKVYYGGGEGLVINEVMSSNSANIADPYGDFDDWVEIYNAGGNPIQLKGYFLTDKDNAPRYWHMPEYIAAPGSFTLVWADDETWQGPLHAPFKISASGEGVYLFRDEPDGIRLVDMVQVPALNTDKSWGRVADAALPWVLFQNPTPGASNGTLSTEGGIAAKRGLPYPNPATDVLYLNDEGPYQIFDLSGRLLLKGNGDRVYLNALNAGMYFIEMNGRLYKFAKTDR